MFISRRTLLISLLSFAGTFAAAVCLSIVFPVRAAPAAEPQAAVLSHFSMSPWAFRPFTSSVMYGVSMSDCMYATANAGGVAIFRAELPLPEGSIIKSVSFSYRNPDPVLKSYVTLFANTAGTETSLTQAAAMTSTVYGVATSPPITVTVDMSNSFYILTWYPNATSDVNQLCGVFVDYVKPPVFGALLPAIQR